jgi:hypothetical protein
MLHLQLGPVLDATKFRHPNASMRIMAKFVLGGGIPAALLAQSEPHRKGLVQVQTTAPRR